MVSTEDVKELRAKGREVFGRDKVEKEARDKGKKEKEEAAKKAREEAAERGRAASRAWAEKMRAKKAAEKKEKEDGVRVQEVEVVGA